MKQSYFKKPLLPLVLVWTSLLAVGCASTKETVLPQEGPTMKSIYDQHMVDVQKLNHRRTIGGQPLPRSGIEHYQGFVREAAELHGGHASLENRTDAEGAEATFWVPGG